MCLLLTLQSIEASGELVTKAHPQVAAVVVAVVVVGEEVAVDVAGAIDLADAGYEDTTWRGSLRSHAAGCVPTTCNHRLKTPQH